MKQKTVSLLLAVIMTLALAAPAFASGGFSDVPSSHWAYNDIMTCAQQGIAAGYEDGTFRPENEVTTIQFLVMLTRTFYADQLNQVATPAGQPWYYANVKVAGDVGMTKGLSAVDNKPMNRYNMAAALKSIIAVNRKSPVDSKLREAEAGIKDFDTMPYEYRIEVRLCYATGVLTGMEDGAFHGDRTMNRAQACAVIVRMMNLINGTAPAAPINPTTPTQSGTRKLANGKDATVENVLEILAQIEKQYPTGTVWYEDVKDPNNHWYGGGGGMNSDVQDLVDRLHYPISLQLACGGWMAMVSDRIFGRNGAPAREVTDLSQVRPGDCVIFYDENGKYRHVAIVAYTDGKREITSFYGVKSTPWIIDTCDGNYNDQVKWPLYEEYSNGPYMYDEELGVKYRIFTRYPE